MSDDMTGRLPETDEFTQIEIATAVIMLACLILAFLLLAYALAYITVRLIGRFV